MKKKKELPPFPTDFLFGVGNSDSQCEAFDARYPDIRDVWYQRRRLQERNLATDFWNRYREDIALARDLGCKIFRFSIAWARVEPAPGEFRQEALDHYSDVVDAILEAGMQPFVTLCHFVWPLHIEERGGLLARAFPGRFAEYATRVVERLGDRVSLWGTFNEPNILSFGYIKPWWERNYLAPPGLPATAGFEQQVSALNLVMRNLFLAHTAARAAIKAAHPGAKVGANPALLGLPVWLQRFMDRNVINLRGQGAGRHSRSFAERRYLEQGKIDVLLALFSKTDSRASDLDFAEIYLIADRRLMVRAESAFHAVADLARERVAVVATSTAQANGEALPPSCERVAFVDHESAFRALEEGKVAAFISDDTRLRPILAASPGAFRLLPEVLASEPYGPAVTKGNPELLEAVNSAVVDFIQSGAWAESYRRHFGDPVPPPPRLPTLATLAGISAASAPVAESAARPGDLLSKIRRRGHIVIGVKDNVPGLSFRDEEGVWSGLEIDIARAIAGRIFGDESALKLVPLSTKERIPMLRSLARLFDPLYKFWGILATTSTTSWWHLGMAGKLPEFLCPSECVGQFDYIAFDYYWGISALEIPRLTALVNALTAGRLDTAPVWPTALYRWLKELGAMFPGAPIVIVENGCVHQADGYDRANYLRRHLAEVQRALAEGVKVTSYLCWSITSNRELGHRFAPHTDFGLFSIDLDNDPALIRHPTDAARLLKEIIRERGV